MHSAAKMFKALADETRLRILLLLFTGELCVCEIIAALALPQSTISRHLAYLKKTGWIRDCKQGVWMYYRINDEGSLLTKQLRAVLEMQLANCPEHMAALEALRQFQVEQRQHSC